jgi:hypothetical protein
MRFGATIWSDPRRLNVSGPGAMAAGRAAAVLTFDVKRGINVVRYRCAGCRTTTFDYSL